MALKYAVIGTGALGGFYGGKLARSGNDVHFLFRSDYDFVKQHGLSIDSPSGDFHLHDIAAYRNVNDMPQCDVILICLKTIHNSMLGRMLPPLMHKDSLVILIQNGLGIEEDLAKALPNVTIAGGLAFICSNKIGPGHIVHLDYGKLNIGSHNAKDPSILQQVCDDFNQAGIPAEVSPNLLLSRWQKLVWNVPFNGMTVVLNTTTDQLMQNEATRQLAYDMMLEVIAGANQCGVALRESFADKMMELTEQMTPYAPSMKLDYDHKRPMEIGYIYSRPLQTALAAGYEMKKVSVLENQLRFIQDRLIF
ncbi:MAG: putative 2-dehydropantoate 2-reductase [Bacteroidota bacterium]|nr:putative 2-dehydropantoate 2-reductase [Bacteroidota bacterium]